VAGRYPEIEPVRARDADLLTRGLGRLFPEAWERFRGGVPATDRDGDLIDAYHRLLNDPGPAVRAKAAQDWWDWEEAIVPTATTPDPRFERTEYRLAFARLITHYWRHGSWLEEGIVLRQAGRLAGIPGVLVQGSLDLGNLLGTLAHAWPGSELILVDDAGHDTTSPDMGRHPDRCHPPFRHVQVTGPMHGYAA
jgi:proline iminopeptidase